MPDTERGTEGLDALENLCLMANEAANRIDVLASGPADYRFAYRLRVVASLATSERGERTDTERLAEMWVESVQVCSYTGDPGCMDCLEGAHDGYEMETFTTFTHCSCGANDVYGELVHEDDCPCVGHGRHPRARGGVVSDPGELTRPMREMLLLVRDRQVTSPAGGGVDVDGGWHPAASKRNTLDALERRGLVRSVRVGKVMSGGFADYKWELTDSGRKEADHA